MNPEFDEVVASFPSEYQFCRSDRKPDYWIRISERIVKGEFDNSDLSTRESLIIGLRSCRVPSAIRAVEHLNSLPKPRVVKTD